MDEIVQRQERTRQLLSDQGYAGALVVGRGFYDRCGSLAWLTNHFPPFPSGPFVDENGGLGHGFLVLPITGKPVLCCDFARKELVAVADTRLGPAPLRLLLDVLSEKSLTGGTLALIGADLIPYQAVRVLQHRCPDLVLEPRDDLVDAQRMQKSPREIGLLRQAAAICDTGLAAAAGAIRPGAREREVCAAGTAAALNAGADFVRYLRVHSGPWSAGGARWPQALDRVIQQGEFVALDLIGAAGGYQFDVNRIAVAGEPSSEQRRLVETVNFIIDAQIAACRSGVTVAALTAVAQEMAEAAGYGQYLVRSQGHGIGLETLEWPYLYLGNPTVIREGMVLCIEPGIFIPGFGGCRIEEAVVVQPEGPPEVITSFPRHLPG